MLRTFSSIPEIKNFFKSIPADRFCKRTREDQKGRHCALGHLDVAMFGEAALWGRSYIGDCGDLLRELTKSNTFVTDIVVANNDKGNSKRNVLSFLDNYIKTNL